MAIISAGYDGTVDEVQWASMIKRVGSSDYGVVHPTGLKVTAAAGADRTVNIAAGQCWGHGVHDTSDSVVSVQLDPITTGTRWDLIVVRRDWTGAGGLTTITAVKGTSTKAIPAARLIGPGTTDDQPLALVQLTAGQTLPTAVVDLRCWSSNGGVHAMDILALGYLDMIGSTVFINGQTWHRVINSSGTGDWAAENVLGAVPLFGTGVTLVGTPTSNSQFLVQAGTALITTDANSFGKLTYPKPFPNGLVSIQLMNGNDDLFNDMGVSIPGASWGTSPANKAYCVFNIWGIKAGVRSKVWPSRTVRVNWIAIGW